jgi:O-antigen/teichoic acid export membrane protein
MTNGLPADPAGSAATASGEVTHGASEIAIRGGAIRVVGYAGGVLVSLGAATILVRHLGISQFGRYATVTSLLAIVSGVTEAGISLHGIREYQARPDLERRELMANLLGMRLAVTLAGVGVATAFAAVAGYPRVLVLGAAVVGAGLLMQVTADVLAIPLQVELRLARLTLVDLTRRTVALALVGVLALAGAGLLPLLAVSIGSSFVAMVMLAWMARASLKLRARFAWRSWRNLFAQTLPSAIAMSIGAVYFYVTIIVMSLIASLNQTGLFATSFRITQVALGVPILLLTAIFPMMSREDASGGSHAGGLFGKVFTAAAICGAWLSLALVLGADAILKVVAGSQGHGALAVLRVQAAVLTVSFLSASSALTLVSLRRFRAMILTSSCALVFNVALGLALIPAYGALGGALADVLTEVIVAVGLTAIVIRVVPDHQLVPSIAAPLLAALTLSGAVVFLPIGSVARVVVGTIVYFGILLVTRSIPEELLRAARGVRALRRVL